MTSIPDDQILGEACAQGIYDTALVVGVGRFAFVSGPFKLNVDQEDGQPTAHPR